MRGRVSTGIDGFDDLIDGGFFEGSFILVAGEPGAGKTIFSHFFMLEGLKRGENCLYVTFVEPEERLLEYGERFGYDLSKYKKKGQLTILDRPIGEEMEMEGITTEILEQVRNKNCSRLVIDSLSALTLGLPETERKRKLIRTITRLLHSVNCTWIGIAEHSPENIEYRFEEYLADGMIYLETRFRDGKLSRNMKIMKMRGTDHARKS
ncbi:MAG: ATPase domain-containing protein, partial [Candidatus Thermoplasmatota archaeon]